MLGAEEFVLQLRHLLFARVDRRAQLIPDPHIGRSMDLRAPLQLRFQAAPQIRRSHANLLEQRSGHAIDLVEQRDQEMFVRDFLLIVLRRNVLRRLQRLLHFLGKFVRSHVRCSNRTVAPANAVSFSR